MDREGIITGETKIDYTFSFPYEVIGSRDIYRGCTRQFPPTNRHQGILYDIKAWCIEHNVKFSSLFVQMYHVIFAALQTCKTHHGVIEIKIDNTIYVQKKWK